VQDLTFLQRCSPPGLKDGSQARGLVTNRMHIVWGGSSGAGTAGPVVRVVDTHQVVVGRALSEIWLNNVQERLALVDCSDKTVLRSRDDTMSVSVSVSASDAGRAGIWELYGPFLATPHQQGPV